MLCTQSTPKKEKSAKRKEKQLTTTVTISENRKKYRGHSLYWLLMFLTYT